MFKLLFLITAVLLGWFGCSTTPPGSPIKVMREDRDRGIDVHVPTDSNFADPEQIWVCAWFPNEVTDEIEFTCLEYERFVAALKKRAAESTPPPATEL